MTQISYVHLMKQNSTSIYEIGMKKRSFHGFIELINNVNFFDPPIITLFIFYFLLVRLIIRYTNTDKGYFILFLLIYFGVISSEVINVFLSNNYDLFLFSSNYFGYDSTFVLVFWTYPLLGFLSFLTILLTMDFIKMIYIRYFICDKKLGSFSS